MITLLGLRNPGSTYTNTRHNVGAWFLEHFAKTHTFSEPFTSGAYQADIARGSINGKEVRIVYPNTFMNLSGATARAMDLTPEEIVVVHDDVALPIGTWKLSVESSAGGHNGVASLISTLGTQQFRRLRIGIMPVSLFGVAHRPSSDRLADFVLGTFSTSEQKKLTALIPALTTALEGAIAEVHALV